MFDDRRPIFDADIKKNLNPNPRLVVDSIHKELPSLAMLEYYEVLIEF